MKTIKDLLIEKNTRNLEIDINERYYLTIEVLVSTPMGYLAMITPEGRYNFDKILGLVVEICDKKNYYESFDRIKANKDTTLEELKALSKIAIKEYEENIKENDYMNVFVYEDIDGDKLAFTETFLNEDQAINYADRFIKYYPRVEVIYNDGTKIY